MNNIKKIGCVGQGFVGTAVREKLKQSFSVYTYDKFNDDNCLMYTDGKVNEPFRLSLTPVVDNCRVIFVCVPTPMFEDGECDTSIVESVIDDIAKECETLDKSVIAIVKSTVPPGTTEKLNSISNRVTVGFSPEFLTEANSIEDFDKQDRIILGLDYLEMVDPVNEIFKTSFPDAEIIIVNSKEAEMTKYMTNLFLATKVSFFNDMYSICEKLGIEYDTVIEATLHDPRIGKSHFMVPGPDGDRGFGGHCFTENHEVLTINGSIPISKAYDMHTKGDLIEVISFDDKLTTEESKIVKEVTKNKYEGEIISFNLDNGSTIECTPEHIFPILRNGKLTLSFAKDITESDEFYDRSNINNKKTMTYDDTKVFR